MNRIDIDFSGHVPFSRKLAWLALAAGITSLACVSGQYLRLQDELERATAERDELRARVEKRAAKESDARLISSDPALEQFHADGSIPWDGLFQSLEDADGEDVALLGLEPSAETMEVRLKGEAKNFDAAMAYLRRLQETNALADVRIVSHQEQLEDPLRPIRFEISAKWLKPVP